MAVAKAYRNESTIDRMQRNCRRLYLQLKIEHENTRIASVQWVYDTFISTPIRSDINNKKKKTKYT